jgi:hypothetical protein
MSYQYAGRPGQETAPATTCTGEGGRLSDFKFSKAKSVEIYIFRHLLAYVSQGEQSDVNRQVPRHVLHEGGA